MDMMPPTQSQILALKVAIAVTSVLSMSTTFYVLLKFTFRKNLHHFEYFMVTMVCFGDFLQATSIGLPTMFYWNVEQSPDVTTFNSQYSKSFACQSQGFIQLLGLLLQFVWVFNIAYSAYTSLIPETDRDTSRRKRLILAIGTILPLTLSMIPVFTKTFGQSEVFYMNDQSYTFNSSICFIIAGYQELEANLTILFTFALPVIAIFIVNTYFFVQIANKLRKVSADNLPISIYCKLISYPMILLLCQFWFLILILVNIAKMVEWYNFQIWCYFISNLNGFFDAITYGFQCKPENSELEDSTSILIKQNKGLSYGIEI